MKGDISKSIKRIDAEDKISGKAKYIGDMKFEDMLYAKTFRSSKSRAKIKSITYPDMIDGYYIVDKNDVPGRNIVKIVLDDQPFFAEDEVNYIGEPIALVVGPDKKEIIDIISKIKIEYEDLQPILTIEQALNAKNPIYKDHNLFANYSSSNGDIENAKSNSKYTIEGCYETGYQEQLYLETQGVIGDYKDGKISVYGSMQCPYYVKGAVEQCMGFSPEKVRIVQTTTGGAFGGKEDYPSIIGGQIACASYKTKKPVQLVLTRDEDLEVTPKRHPSKIKIKTYISEDYKILGLESEIYLDGGAYVGLSLVVLQRAMFAAIGVYNIENCVVKGKCIATNKVVSGGFRGFGAPQAFFAIEMHMEHIAKELGLDSLELKKINIVKQWDKSSTGGMFREKILLPEMIDKAIDMSDYNEKKKAFKEDRKQGKLKGIGMSLFFHGGGFTGSGERDVIKSKVKLIKNNNKVELLISNVEMGQGLQTTMRKIVSKAIDMPIEDIIYNNPDTDKVSDSGPTVASRSIVIVGKLVEEAALKIKARWDEKGKIEVETNYKYPEGFFFDDKKFIGDAYTSYSWGINVVEVEIDPITFESKINGVYAVYDVGKAIDEKIVKGQIDGGIVQGLGYGGIEVMEIKDGKLMQRTNTDYTISTSKDAPPIKSCLINQPYEDGPSGAKAVGELTLIGAAPAYALAVSDAMDIEINKIPVKPENLMEASENED
ncbi:MAG: xanthine dehydrogenase family protein molybdopterin-binding subunit [Clostridiaceae bacterium]